MIDRWHALSAIRRHHGSRVARAIALIAVCARPMIGQTPDSARVQSERVQSARLIGVFDARTGAPLSGVRVLDTFSGTSAVTTNTGTVRLSFLTFRGGAAVVELGKLGYQAKRIIVGRSDTTSITEIMEPFVELAPIVATEKYSIDRDAGRWDGFERRCQSRLVTCIRNDALEKRPAANLADFLVHAPGVTIGSCGGGASRGQRCGKISMRSTTIPPSYCEPTFFVDGFEWNSRIGAPTDLTPNTPAQAPYTPGNVKAVEVYSSERNRPPRFEGDPTCGVVVIWTK
jgi:TonB-dependent receptor-like protein